ncbi:UNVERIFIED_CONTAM: hypothetical protein GTU68_041415 [Idotea baltica]|nr:hypothetical protein [Idotea baltica]
MVILMDDEDRENEGDLIIASDCITAEHINFMVRFARGLICMPMTKERCEYLDLPLMAQRNLSGFGTNFTVSIEASEGVTTGISAADRAKTVQVAIDKRTQSSDLVSPGHIFPLMARDGGVLSRAGHTEAACDLARLAGFEPSGVICEIMNDDGTMARREQLEQFAQEHNIKIGTIADLIHYRLTHEKTIERVSEQVLTSELGVFNLVTYRDKLEGDAHMALVLGDITSDAPVLARLHSECLTGDSLFSLRCDCGAQLNAALQLIAKEGRGALLYLRQEGRGIGLLNKIRAYHLQDQGADTVEANQQLGFAADERNYAMCLPMLQHLGIKSLKLMTNNPEKIKALDDLGVVVAKRVSLITPDNPYNANYWQTKVHKMGHLISDND